MNIRNPGTSVPALVLAWVSGFHWWKKNPSDIPVPRRQDVLYILNANGKPHGYNGMTFVFDVEIGTMAKRDAKTHAIYVA